MLALDGNTLRGAHVRADGGVYIPHLVSVLDQASGVVLGQVQVDHKTSEVAAFGTLLDELDLSDVLVTADALHTHRGHSDYLHQRRGHYLITIKANQPRVRALPWADVGIATRERARGHGRVETRTISVVNLHPCPDARRVLPARRPGDQAGTPLSPAAPGRQVKRPSQSTRSPVLPASTPIPPC